MHLLTKLALPLLLLTLLSACASTKGISIQEKEAEVAGYTLPSLPETGQAYVYVVRPDTVGFAVRFKVYLDGKKDEGTYIGYTRGKQYLAFPVTVGKHTIYSKAENWASVEIDAQDQSQIFLKQTPKMGILFSGNSLEEIDALDGKYFMKKMDLKPGTFTDVDD